MSENEMSTTVLVEALLSTDGCQVSVTDPLIEQFSGERIERITHARRQAATRLHSFGIDLIAEGARKQKLNVKGFNVDDSAHKPVDGQPVSLVQLCGDTLDEAVARIYPMDGCLRVTKVDWDLINAQLILSAAFQTAMDQEVAA